MEIIDILCPADPGYCQCGCGNKTQLADRNRHDRTQLKGEPLRYIQGHSHGARVFLGRFWAKVQVGDGCWLWLAHTNNKGYGVIGVGNRLHLAHRISYMISYGPIPNGLELLHSCDNPPCVFPGHLRIGTHAENMAEASAKGRFPTGDRHWTVKRKKSAEL